MRADKKKSSTSLEEIKKIHNRDEGLNNHHHHRHRHVMMVHIIKKNC